MAFHRSFQIVFYNYMFGLMDELGESKKYNGSDSALPKDIVLRQEMEKIKSLGSEEPIKKSLPLFNMEWETTRGAYEMAVSIGKSMYSRNSKEGFVLKPISCYFDHLSLKHKKEVKSEREYCRSLFDIFHAVYPWKNLIMVYGDRDMKTKEVDAKFIELMSKVNKPKKKSDRNYDGRYYNYRYKVSQNLMKDDLAYYNPIYINLFAEWRVSVDNNWDYEV